MTSGSSGGGSGPCGACKYLRRKCVSGCVFAPYFDAEQGAAHFAAVHRVFGASNASKLLLRIPPHRRFDAVVTLCYEALARVRDPVYGCVSHVFSLQQQVVNLQAELAHIQARLSTLHRVPAPQLQPPTPPECPPPVASPTSTAATASTSLDPSLQPQRGSLITPTTVCSSLADQAAPGGGLPEPLLDDDGGCCDLHTLSSELVYKYFSGPKFCSSE